MTRKSGKSAKATAGKPKGLNVTRQTLKDLSPRGRGPKAGLALTNSTRVCRPGG